MKKHLLLKLFFIILIFPQIVYSQRQDFNSKTFSLDFGAGATTHGFIGELAFDVHSYRNPRTWGRFALEYYQSSIAGKDIENFNRDIQFPIRDYTLNASFNNTIIQIPGQYQMLNMHAYIYLDLGAGGVIGYESINNEKYVLKTGEEITDRNKIIYGGLLRADLEVFFDIPQVTVYIACQQKFLVNSDIGKSRLSLNLGIRYWLKY